MKSKLKTPSKLSGLAFAAFWLTPSPLGAETFDFEFQGGQTEVATRKFQEIDKRGYAFGLSALKRISLPPVGDFALGLGAWTTKVEGKKTSRGITQDLDASFLSIDLRYLYTFYPNLSAGPVLRGYFGRGAKYAAQGNDDVDFQLAPGVMLRYVFPTLVYQPALTLHYSHDANIAKRDIQTILLGAAITVGFGEGANAPAAPVPQTPSSSIRDSALTSPEVEGEGNAAPTIIEVPTVGAPPATPPAEKPAATPSESKAAKDETTQASDFLPLVFRFAPNSTRLNGISRERAKALAKVLVEHPNDYGTILVTGHSDKSGDAARNLELSRKRTDAFCDLLAKRGVPRKKMRCEPMGFQTLIPGLPDNAEEHRRIEVVFEGLSTEQIGTWRSELQKALQL